MTEHTPRSGVKHNGNVNRGASAGWGRPAVAVGRGAFATHLAELAAVLAWIGHSWLHPGGNIGRWEQ